MVVAGKCLAIINVTGRKAKVVTFTLEHDYLSKVSILDAAIKHICPFISKNFLLMRRNYLSVLVTNHNLMPPFIIREAGVDIRFVPKIQFKNP